MWGYFEEKEFNKIIEYFFENETFGWMFDQMFDNPDDNYGPHEQSYAFLLQDAVAKYINKHYDLVWEYEDAERVNGKWVECIKRKPLVLGIRKNMHDSSTPCIVFMPKDTPDPYNPPYVNVDELGLSMPTRPNSHVRQHYGEEWSKFVYEIIGPVFSRIITELKVFTQKGLNDILNDIKERSTDEEFIRSISKLLIERIIEAYVRSRAKDLVSDNSLTESLSTVKWTQKPDQNLEIFEMFYDIGLHQEDFDFNAFLKEVLSKYASDYEEQFNFFAHPYWIGLQLNRAYPISGKWASYPPGDSGIEGLFERYNFEKTISGDKKLLQLALENLMENAIHNSSPFYRQILISYYSEDYLFKDYLGLKRETDEEYPFKIVIKDNGAGIAPEHLDSIRNPFVSYPTKYNVMPGRGLGLFAAESIIRAHEGLFTIESEGIDQGCTVIIRLPRSPLTVHIYRLQHGDRDKRCEAAWKLGEIPLGEIGKRTAIDALTRALKDEDSTVRYKAIEALEKIPKIHTVKRTSIDDFYPFEIKSTQMKRLKTQLSGYPLDQSVFGKLTSHQLILLLAIAMELYHTSYTHLTRVKIMEIYLQHCESLKIEPRVSRVIWGYCETLVKLHILTKSETQNGVRRIWRYTITHPPFDKLIEFLDGILREKYPKINWDKLVKRDH